MDYAHTSGYNHRGQGEEGSQDFTYISLIKHVLQLGKNSTLFLIYFPELYSFNLFSIISYHAFSNSEKLVC